MTTRIAALYCDLLLKQRSEHNHIWSIPMKPATIISCDAPFLFAKRTHTSLKAKNWTNKHYINLAHTVRTRLSHKTQKQMQKLLPTYLVTEILRREYRKYRDILYNISVLSITENEKYIDRLIVIVNDMEFTFVCVFQVIEQLLVHISDDKYQYAFMNHARLQKMVCSSFWFWNYVSKLIASLWAVIFHSILIALIEFRIRMYSDHHPSRSDSRTQYWSTLSSSLMIARSVGRTRSYAWILGEEQFVGYFSIC